MLELVYVRVGLPKLLDVSEPFAKDELSELIQRSLDSFCNFYSSSVAPDVGPAKDAASLTLLSRVDEELDDISP